jgi:hypothetical protein
MRRKDNRREWPVEIKSGMPDAGPGEWKSTRDERQSRWNYPARGKKALLAALVNAASSLKGQ